MDTSELIEKLEGYLDLSKKKQKKKHDKYIKIIDRLAQKKTALEAELVEQSKIDETSDRHAELSQELKIVSRLLKKARKQDRSGE